MTFRLMILLSVSFACLLTSVSSASAQQWDLEGYTPQEVAEGAYCWMDMSVGDVNALGSRDDGRSSDLDSVLPLLLGDGSDSTDDIFTSCLEMFTPAPSRSTNGQLSYSFHPSHWEHQSLFVNETEVTIDFSFLDYLLKDLDDLLSEGTLDRSEDALVHVQMEAELFCGVVSSLTNCMPSTETLPW